MAIVINGSGTVSGLTAQASDVELTDSTKVLLGTGDDLQLYHDGSNSYIDEAGTGGLKINANNSLVIGKYGGAESMAVFDTDGAVTLYHDNSAKIATTNTGVDVTGVATTDGLTSSGNITFDNGNSSVSIKSDGANGSYIQFGSNEYLRFLYDNGASESIRLIDGGGITFNGDTATANALDDYEEGTWTVGIGSGTISAGDGVYTKVGNKVTAWFQANTFSDRTTATAINIQGLPFTSASTMGNASCSSIMCRHTDNTAANQAYLSNSVTSIAFYGSYTGAWDTLKYNDLNSVSSSLYGSVTYYVD